MNGIVYRIKWRVKEKWTIGHFVYDTDPLSKVQEIAQEVVDKNHFNEVVVEAQDREKWTNWVRVSSHHPTAETKKPIPRKCPWCKQRGKTKVGDDGFWYAGCFGGFCPVSPCTSGQETEEEAIRVWNSFK